MVTIDKILLATHNPAKINRFRRVFANFSSEILSLSDLRIQDKPDESGETAEENAIIKARFYRLKTELPVFAEDESLYVDFLPLEKQPGVHVRRIEGKDEVDDRKLLIYWEKLVSNVPKEKRTGHWHIAYALAFSQDKIISFALDSPIIFFSPPSKVRLPGWPISSLQGPADFGKPHSELTGKEIKKHEEKLSRLILKKMLKLEKG
ncbi:MAG TPA: non-canonical purine NTP pyrophosphatase [Candidatus Bathyarchaeia archaeon]|nr:non-canonical purine NTP pyrophosphatase [Candidatus Bathyarchaeia archaeon]